MLYTLYLIEYKAKFVNKIIRFAVHQTEKKINPSLYSLRYVIRFYTLFVREDVFSLFISKAHHGPSCVYVRIYFLIKCSIFFGENKIVLSLG